MKNKINVSKIYLKYKKVGVLPMIISHITLETLDYTIRIGSTPTFFYFDLYLYSAYATHLIKYTVAA